MRAIDRSMLEDVVRRLVAALMPTRIYLFGSHAYGRPGVDSDIDILIVVPDSPLPPQKRAQAAHRALRGLLLPADLVVVTRAEFDRRRPWMSSLERVASEKGRVLYETVS